MIKCVVWDIDNTLLDGVFLESGLEYPVAHSHSAAEPPADRYPPADPAMAAVLTELAGRGILHALASRNPPAAAEYVQQVTGHRFAAAECGWGRKSDAIRRIGSELGLAANAIAFIDDDAMERAEVSFALPEVMVLAPEDMTEAAGWAQFSPATVTDEARRRGELYLIRRRRQEEAKAFGGSRDDFLRYCQTRVVIGPASTADLPRLHELSVRTHQFNSAGRPVSEDVLSGLLDAPDHRVITVRLSDRYGDDGLVGGCIIAIGGQGEAEVKPSPPEPASDPASPPEPASDPAGRPEPASPPDSARRPEPASDPAGPPGPAGRPGPASPAGPVRPVCWDVPLLMMSCRAMGRGVIDALLAWICRAARQAGAGHVMIPCVVNPQNVPLRIALTGAGFRADAMASADRPPTQAAARTAAYCRRLDAPLPELPSWAADQAGETST